MTRAGRRGWSRRLARCSAWLCSTAWSLSGGASTLQASPPDPPRPPAEAATTPEYESGSLAAIVDFGYGSSAVGDTLLGDVGAESFGIRSFLGRALLAQWDTLFAARGGILGNEHPYTPLLGARRRRPSRQGTAGSRRGAGASIPAPARAATSR